MHLPIYLKRERWYCIVLNTLSKGSKRALAIRILTYFKVFLKKSCRFFTAFKLTHSPYYMVSYRCYIAQRINLWNGFIYTTRAIKC